MEQAPLALWCRAAAVAVLALAAFDLVVRHTPLLTAVWLAGLAVAILLQSGRPSRLRTWLGRGVAAAMGVLAAGVLAGYLAGKSFGPPPRTAASVLYLSGAVLLMRIDRRRTGLFWGIFLLAAVATPLATVMGHMFRAVSDVHSRPSQPASGSRRPSGCCCSSQPPCWLVRTAIRLPGC